MEIVIVRLHPALVQRLVVGCDVVGAQSLDGLHLFLGVGGVGGTTAYLEVWQHRCIASQRGLVPDSPGHRRRGAWCLGG